MNLFSLRSVSLAAAVLSSAVVGAATISVSPGDDLVAKVATAASGDTIEITEGTYTIAEQITLAGKSDITFIGAGKVVITRGDSASCRFFKIEDCENIQFSNFVFSNGVAAASSSDATASCGGAIYASNVTGLKFFNCCFFDNKCVNDTVAATSGSICQGGAVYAINSFASIVDCVFERNATDDRKSSNSVAVQGCAVYVANPEGATSASARWTLGVTNTIIRANWGYVACGEFKEPGEGIAVCGSQAGLDFYNCLISGNYFKGTKLPYSTVHAAGDGSICVFTQCTIADNMAHRVVFGAIPVYVRSVISGEIDLGCNNTFDSGAGACLIDSVYTMRECRKKNPVTSPVTVCKQKFTPSNSVRTDPMLVHEGEAQASEAIVRNAGWRPAVARTYRTIYVAPNGSDDFGDGSKAGPYRTLTKALSVILSGETIELAEGHYTPTAGEVLPIAVANLCNVTVKGAGVDKTFLDGELPDNNSLTFMKIDSAESLKFQDLTFTGAKASVSATGTPALFQIENAAGLVFDHVAITGNVSRMTANARFNGLIVADFSSILFRNSVINDNTVRMYGKWGSSATIDGGFLSGTFCHLWMEGCEVRRFYIDQTEDVSSKTSYGGYNNNFRLFLRSMAEAGFNSLEFRNCTFDDVGTNVTTLDKTLRTYDPSYSDIFYFLGTETKLYFDNNTVCHCASPVPFFCVQANVVVRDSIITGTGPFYRNADKNRTLTVYDSLFTMSAEEDESIAKLSNYSTFEADGVKLGADAKFKDAANGDYHLTEESTLAIDKGAMLDWMSEASVDLDGNPRLVGYLNRKELIPDIGCYELPRKKKGLMLLLK